MLKTLENQTWLAALLESVGDGVAASDAAGLVSYLNPAAERLTGWSHATAIGLPFAEVFKLVVGPSRRPVADIVSRVLSNGERVVASEDTLLLRRDGALLHTEVRATAIRAADGAVNGVVLALRDVTEERRARDALARQSRHAHLLAEVGQALARDEETSMTLSRACQALVDQMGAACARVWLIEDSPTTLVLRASRGIRVGVEDADCEVQVGKSRLGLIAEERHGYLSNSALDDSVASDTDWLKREGLSAFAGAPLIVDKRLLGLVALNARDALPPETLEVLQLVADRLALGLEGRRLHREREELLRASREAHRTSEAARSELERVLSQAPVGVAIHEGLDLRYTLANEAYRALLGHRQLLGRRLLEAVPEVRGTGFDEILRQVMASGVPTSAVEQPFSLELDGHARLGYYTYLFVPLRGETGDVSGVMQCTLDVTEQVQARAKAGQLSERLAEQEELLRLALQSAGMSTFALDVRSGLVETDARFRGTYGFGAGEKVPLSALLERTHPEDRPKTEAAIAAALTGDNEGRYSSIRRIKGPSGEYAWGEVRGQVSFDEAGNAVSLRGVSFDVSARKRAEALQAELFDKSRTESERLNAIFQQAPAAICVLAGPEHRFVVANPLYLRLVGDREVLGRAAAEAIPEVVEQGFIALLDRVRQTGEAFLGTETWLKLQRHRNGPPDDVCLDFVYQPVRDGDGTVAYIFVHAVDVTAQVLAREAAARSTELLRASEQRLTQLLQSIASQDVFGVAVLTGPDLMFTLANDGYRRFVGGRDVVGKPLLRALPELAGQGADSVLREVIKTGEGKTLRETRYLVDMGAGALEPRYFTSAVRAVPSVDGAFDSVLVMTLDISESVLGRERVRTLAEQERARAEFAQQLIGIVSHDLRNPLSAIEFAAHALKAKGHLDGRSLKFLERITNSTRRAERMVKDLLDFTQVKLSGGLRVEAGRANLHELTADMVEEVRAAHPGAQIRLSHDGEGDGQWDEARLEQVVQNLVVNALKFGAPGEAINVRTSGDEERVTLSVHNLGNAIAPERQESIFQPMQRGTEQVDRQARSVGLGLFIVRAIVEAHGGSVTLESLPQTGTTFTVSLPRELPKAV